MWSDDLPVLEKFKGSARLFPLPNLVLFPSMMQALHIFEPRYRQMTADALADDRLIAMVLLRPGWEAKYQNNPPIYSMACLGRILNDEKLADGRYNLQLRGLCRAHIVGEVPSDKPYRSARLQLQFDASHPTPKTAKAMRKRLMQALADRCDPDSSAYDVLIKLLQSDVPLGTVTDIFSFALPLAVEIKQELLETLDVAQRVRQLLKCLGKKPGDAASIDLERKFPPDFSPN